MTSLAKRPANTSGLMKNEICPGPDHDNIDHSEARQPQKQTKLSGSSAVYAHLKYYCVTMTI